MCVMP